MGIEPSLNGADQMALQALPTLQDELTSRGDGASTLGSASENDPLKPKRQEDYFSLSHGLLRSIWHPEAFRVLDPTSLPPAHYLNDILAQLSITLNPSTQLRAARSPVDTPISEPTLMLYSPMECGEVGFTLLCPYRFLG